MAYDLTEKLVVAVASSALFDLTESDRVFQDEGEDAYRAYQREHEHVTLKTGVAFPLIKRLLQLNNDDEEPSVEVILFSRNDPDTGLRVFKSIEAYELPITRAVFVTGRNPFPYMNAFNAALFLSGNEADVREAIAQGLPAGHVSMQTAYEDDADHELRLAFDFDGVLADDPSEKIFKQATSFTDYVEHERKYAEKPMPEGPLFKFFKGIAAIQQKELQKAKDDKTYQPKIRIALCTARNAPAIERVVTTLRNWNIHLDEAFFLGGLNKLDVLRVYRPHIFFDDQYGHIEHVGEIFPSVHIPYGIANVRDDGGSEKIVEFNNENEVKKRLKS